MKIVSLSALLLPTVYGSSETTRSSESLSRDHTHFQLTVTDHTRAGNADADDGYESRPGCDAVAIDGSSGNTVITWTCHSNVGSVVVEDSVKDQFSVAVSDALGAAGMDHARADVESKLGNMPELHYSMETQGVSTQHANTLLDPAPGTSLTSSSTDVTTGVVTLNERNGVLIPEHVCSFQVQCTVSSSVGGAYTLKYIDDTVNGCVPDTADAGTERSRGITMDTGLGADMILVEQQDEYSVGTQLLCAWDGEIQYPATNFDLAFSLEDVAPMDSPLQNTLSSFSVSSSKTAYSFAGFTQDDLTNNAVTAFDLAATVGINDTIIAETEIGGTDDGSVALTSIQQEINMVCTSTLTILGASATWFSHDWAAVQTTVSCPTATISTSSAGSASNATGVNAIHLIQDYTVRPLALECDANYLDPSQALLGREPACMSDASFLPSGDKGCTALNPSYTYSQGDDSATCLASPTQGVDENPEFDLLLPPQPCASRKLHIGAVKYKQNKHGYEVVHYMRSDTSSTGQITLDFSSTIVADTEEDQANLLMNLVSECS